MSHQGDRVGRFQAFPHSAGSPERMLKNFTVLTAGRSAIASGISAEGMRGAGAAAQGIGVAVNGEFLEEREAPRCQTV